jgi:hypothetical protein
MFSCRLAGGNDMTDRIKDLVEIISDLEIESVERKDFESFLEIAMARRLLFRALPGAEEQSRLALCSIENALSLLIRASPPDGVSKIDPACSFCGKRRPEVQIGAGADAFICNECVDLFTEIFRMEKVHGGSPEV